MAKRERSTRTKPLSKRRYLKELAKLQVDLEAVDILADGRVVALSERLHALVSDGGLVAEYPDFLGEVGGIGLEGREFGPAILQRFSAGGRLVGPALDLRSVAPALGPRNWEGLGWFTPGQSLVLVHDQPSGDSVALVVPLDTWPTGSPR
jgi:hypothetical protein